MVMKHNCAGARALAAIAVSCSGSVALSPPLPGHVVSSGIASEDKADELAIERLEVKNEGYERDADHMLMFSEMEDNLANIESHEADVKRWDGKAISKATWVDSSSSKQSKSQLLNQATDARKLAEVAGLEYKDVQGLRKEALQMHNWAENLEHKTEKDLANEKKDTATLRAAVAQEESKSEKNGPAKRQQSNASFANASLGMDFWMTEKRDEKATSISQAARLHGDGAANVAPKGSAAGTQPKAKTLSAEDAADVAEQDAEQMEAMAEDERWRAHKEMMDAKRQRDDGKAIKFAVSIDTEEQSHRTRKEAQALRKAMLDAANSEEAARDMDARHLELAATLEEEDAEHLLEDAAQTQADAARFHREAVDMLKNASMAASLQAADTVKVTIPADHAGRNSSAAEAAVPAGSSQVHDVSCGGHRAPTCGECTQGNGESWCNDECHWLSGLCVSIGGPIPIAAAALSPVKSKADQQLEGDAEHVLAVAEIEDQEAKEEIHEASVQNDDAKAIKVAAQLEFNAVDSSAKSGQAKVALRRKAAEFRAERNTDANQLSAVAELEEKDAMVLQKDSAQLRADANKFHLEAVGDFKGKVEMSTGSVSCGGHMASSCGDCPQGNGETWCNEDCHWISGSCLAVEASAPKLALVQFLGPLKSFEA